MYLLWETANDIVSKFDLYIMSDGLVESVESLRAKISDIWFKFKCL